MQLGGFTSNMVQFMKVDKRAFSHEFFQHIPVPVHELFGKCAFWSLDEHPPGQQVDQLIKTIVRWETKVR